MQQGAAAASSTGRLPRPAYDQPRHSAEDLQEVTPFSTLVVPHSAQAGCCACGAGSHGSTITCKPDSIPSQRTSILGHALHGPLLPPTVMRLQKPLKQRQPRPAKPRPGSQVPSFIVVSDAPAESAPQQPPAAAPHTGRQASARTSQDSGEPRAPWQNSLLEQPARPGLEGSAPQRSPTQSPELSQGVPASEANNIPGSAPPAPDPSVQTQRRAQADGVQPLEGAGQRLHGSWEREASLPKVRQLRPRSTARAAAQPAFEAPSENALAR